MMPQRKGIVFVISAPSGAGKTTLIQRLLAEFPLFTFSISYTTRKPRADEVDGIHYHFITEEEFLILRNNNFFVEWAFVHGAYYGTPLEATQQLLENGRDVLFDIDVQGAKQLHEVFHDGVYIFILPPSYTVLKERLQMRGTDNESDILRRLNNAEIEISLARWFSIWIVNDEIEDAYQKLRATYIASTLSPQCNPEMLDYILSQWKH